MTDARFRMVAVLAALILGPLQRLDAQSNAATGSWAIGLSGLAGAQPLAMGSLGIEVSHYFPLSASLGWRTDLAVHGAIDYGQRDRCFGFGLCDQRRVGWVGTAKGMLTLGTAAAGLKDGVYALVGSGAYATWWHDGTYTPAQGVVAAEEVRGSGPLGLVVDGGIGWRTPLVRDRLSFEFLAHRFFRLANGDVGALSISCRTSW
jgi:hypothetical protein